MVRSAYSARRTMHDIRCSDVKDKKELERFLPSTTISNMSTAAAADVVKPSILNIKPGELTGAIVPVLYFCAAPLADRIVDQYNLVALLLARLPAGIISDKAIIVALGTWYLAVAYPLSGGLSIFGQSTGAGVGYDNKSESGQCQSRPSWIMLEARVQDETPG